LVTLPVLDQSRVTVKCGEPKKIKIEAEIRQPKDMSCPLIAR
jgi:hypothetical protein